MGGYEQINKDIQWLDGIAYRYSDFPTLPLNDPKQAIELIQLFPQASATFKAAQERYETFLQADNADTNGLKAQMTEAAQNLGQVVPTLRQQFGEILQYGNEQIFMSDTLIKEAEATRNPVAFGRDGNVTRQMEEAELRIGLATHVDAEKSKPLVESYGELKARAAKVRNSLKKEIIAENKGYGDGYRGGDREAGLAGAREAFAGDYPDDKIVKVLMGDIEWDRNTRWEWFVDAWYFVDKSFHQAIVVYEAKNEAGELEYQMLPVRVTKDHTENDALRFSAWVKQPLDEMDLNFRMLPENFEK